MNEQDKRALEIWASTTSAPLAKGIIIDFARRIRQECAKGEPVAWVSDHRQATFWKEVTPGTKLYATPVAREGMVMVPKEPTVCSMCSGQGWYAAHGDDEPIQVQCEICQGTGSAAIDAARGVE